MSGPALAGVFLYARHLHPLVEFYRRVLGMEPVHSSSEFVILNSPHLQLVVHAMPEPIARTISVSIPPRRREESAVKFFHAVPSIAAARAEAASLGGEVCAEQWSGPGFVVCNAMDPEGNIFQVRERTP